MLFSVSLISVSTDSLSFSRVETLSSISTEAAVCNSSSVEVKCLRSVTGIAGRVVNNALTRRS